MWAGQRLFHVIRLWEGGEDWNFGEGKTPHAPKSKIPQRPGMFGDIEVQNASAMVADEAVEQAAGTGTVKKSIAAMASPWLRRKASQRSDRTWVPTGACSKRICLWRMPAREGRRQRHRISVLRKEKQRR